MAVNVLKKRSEEIGSKLSVGEDFRIAHEHRVSDSDVAEAHDLFIWN
jgi:hypothetical protein